MNVINIFLVVIVVLLVWVAAIYNRFVKLRTRAGEAWSDIDVQLKRRYDLIPNLVETVKGYASHESATFEKVTAARTAAMNAGSVEEQAKAENMLTGALKSLFAVTESYPDLKANQNFLELQKELTDTENKIQASRRFYNANVRDLNIGVDTFPQNVVARLFNVMKREFFEVSESEKGSIKVDF